MIAILSWHRNASRYERGDRDKVVVVEHMIFCRSVMKR